MECPLMVMILIVNLCPEKKSQKGNYGNVLQDCVQSNTIDFNLFFFLLCSSLIANILLPSSQIHTV